MPFQNPTQTESSRLAKLSCAALCLLWMLAGNQGHDLWKSDDAIHLGIAYGVAQGSWLIPQIAGEAWITSPPLYHWIAAICGKALGALLAWHDAARLASALFGGAFLFALSITAKRLYGPSASLAAPFLAIGTLGFLVPLHDAQPIGAGLAAWTLALWSLSHWNNHPLRSGLGLGIGIGAGFLAIGITGALLPLATALALLTCSHWRSPGSLKAWAVALVAATAISLPWPWLLHGASPDLFATWWQQELTRPSLLSGFSRDHFEMLSWASWPVLPLAVWALWLERRRLSHAQNSLPLAAALAALLVFFFGDLKEISILPALAPITLLAANGAGRLRRGAANAFDWFGMMTFTLLAAVVWLGGIAALTGEPQRVAKNFYIPAPDYAPHLSMPLTLLAIAASVAWIAVMLRTPRSPWRAAARWSVGLTTVWILGVTLLMPWIDHVRTYRQISSKIQLALTTDKRRVSRTPDCILREGLSPVHRASLDYYDGIRTHLPNDSRSCRYLLVQADPKKDAARFGWTLITEVSRPADKSEVLRLYRKR